MKEILNDKPFSYVSANGVLFKCDRCDLSGGVEIHSRDKDAIILAVAEMAAYHAMNIRPNLNGFQGYDCIRFEYK